MNLCASIAIALLLPVSAYAAEINVPEIFGDGGTPNANGWTFKNGGVFANAGEGGAGDHALLYRAASLPPNSNGFHLLHPGVAGPANPVFLGDYLAAGATAIQFKARHTGIGDSVVLRAAAFDTFANGVDFATSTVPVTVSNSATTWQTYQLSLAPGDLFAGGQNLLSVTDILGAVAQIGLRHDPLGTGPLTPSLVANPTEVWFDDVVLIPEPSVGLFIVIGLVIPGLRRRV